MTTFTPATAPVSFGVFGSVARMLTAEQILDAFVAAGFQAIELGPPGLFGGAEAASEAVQRRGLQAIGAYAPFHFTADDETFADEVSRYDVTLDELAACGTPGARAILADEGTSALRRMPSRPVGHPLSWTDAQWSVAAERIEWAADRARRRGLTASFHPHLTTHVENQNDVAELLARTSVGLTVDTGHFLLGGIDPVAFVAAHPDRVNHLHVKDVSLAAVPSAEVAGTLDLDDWFGSVGVPLGTGDVDLAAFFAAAKGVGAPWVVIEQDRTQVTPDTLPDVIAGEAANRRVLQAIVAAA